MSKKSRPERNFESRAGTAAVWAGETASGYERATQTPVVHSVAYAYENLN